MSSVSKRDIIAAVEAKTGVKRQLATNVLDAAFEAIGDELAKGNKVSITGYLTFGFRVTKPIRKGTMTRNPFTGEEAPHAGKPAGIRVKVMPGQKLKGRAPAAGTKVGKAIIAGGK
jgi:DNA-binding protein HU-beta